MARFAELVAEFRAVLGGGRLVDSILPPLLFALLHARWGLGLAVLGAVGIAALLFGWRLLRGQPWLYATLGLAGVGIAALGAWGSGTAEGFFLPDLLTGALLTLGCLVSILMRRPLVALTSHVARGWPLPWYWQEQVRPAYNEVTAAWAVFFGARLVLQLVAYLGERPAALLWLSVLGGWPATIVLLAASYLYGVWRLARLGGPSVEEFRRSQPPPWQGQRRGF